MSSSTRHRSEQAAPENGNPRETFVSIGNAFARVLLVVILIVLALFLILTRYLHYCTISLPAGTTVVDSRAVPRRAPLAETVYNSYLRYLPGLELYLDYRHYTVPEGATEIAGGAFRNVNREIRSVRIPGSVKTIGYGAFEECNLTEVVMKDGVETIGYGAFERCRNLTKVVIPGSVRTIGYGAFKECSNLTKVVMQDGVETIGSRAFVGCENLSGINIPDSVIEIGDYAFATCRKLPSVTLGRGLKRIGGGAFTMTDCRISVPDDHPAFRLVDGLLYSKDLSTLVLCASNPDGPVVVAPEVRIIAAYAFSERAGLTDIRLPESLEIILDHAFSCTELKELTIPPHVTEVGQEAFSGCFVLKRVTLPESLKTIPIAMFMDCKALEEIVIPESVTTIDNAAFIRCTNLKRVTLPGALTAIPERMFMNCKSLEEIVIPEGVTTIGYSAFYGCTNLKRVTLPDSLEDIGSEAFAGCDSLDRDTLKLPPRLKNKPVSNFSSTQANP